MAKTRSWLLGLLGLLVAVVLVLALVRITEDPEYRARRAQFDQVRVGMSKPEVLAQMGAPSSREAKFRLAQRQGFEKEYARAQNSHSREWWLWDTGDFVFAVGFGEDNHVKMKSHGGT